MLTLAAFAALDWTALIAYFAMMIAIGFWAARGQSGSESFFLGGRSIPAWAVALSLVATSLSAATFVAVPQLAYTGDWTYLIFNIGAILGAIIVATVFIPPLYRAGTVTIYGYLEQRLGPKAAMGASIAFLLGRLLASGARLFIAAIPFSLILFNDSTASHVIVSVIVLGVIGTFYTVCGGIKAVIWTDVAQVFIVIAAALLSIYILLDRIDLPLGEIVQSLTESPAGDKLRIIDTSNDVGKSFTLVGGLLATFLYVASFGVDQDLIQRCMTTRSVTRASWSMLASNLLAVPVIMLFLAIGSLLFVYHATVIPIDTAQAAIDTKDVYPRFLINELPVGLTGLAMAGLFAAAMSSFDSAVNAMAASAVSDIHTPWRKRQTNALTSNTASNTASDTTAITASDTTADSASSLHAPRYAVVIMGVLLTAFAIAAVFMQQAGEQSLIDFALGVMTFAYAGLLGVFLTALLTRRGNGTSAIAALIVGALVVLFCQPYMLSYFFGEQFKLGMPWYLAFATTISFLTCVSGRGQAAHASLSK